MSAVLRQPVDALELLFLDVMSRQLVMPALAPIAHETLQEWAHWCKANPN